MSRASTELDELGLAGGHGFEPLEGRVNGQQVDRLDRIGHRRFMPLK
jgi:hypothetical protein